MIGEQKVMFLSFPHLFRIIPKIVQHATLGYSISAVLLWAAGEHC